MQSIFKEMLNELDKMLKGYRYYTMERTHARQVMDYGIILSERENSDMDIVVPATIFHDVGRYIGLPNHREVDFDTLSSILKKFRYADNQIHSVQGCIRTHSINSKQKPSTIEQKVVFDSDNLTLITPFGTTRWFFMAEEWGGVTNIKDAIENLAAIYQKIDEKEFFYTDTARKIANKNTFFRTYIEDLTQEVNKFKL